MVFSRGFRGKRREGPPDRVPPGQYLTDDFPVLSAGPTPHTPLDEWTFSIRGGAEPVSWTWDEFRALPSETLTVDIHCVTKWSKLDTVWEGVSVDTLLDAVEHDAAYVLAFCDGGYTTNLPLEDVTDGKAWVAYGYDGEPLDPEHGGPARLLVPHLYFWKSAKWVRGLSLARRGRARLLGVERLPPARRPVAGAAVLGRLTWLAADGGGASHGDAAGADARARRARLARPPRRASTSTSGSPPRTATRRSAATRSRRRPGEAARAHGRAARRRRGLAVPRGRGARG